MFYEKTYHIHILFLIHIIVTAYSVLYYWIYTYYIKYANVRATEWNTGNLKTAETFSCCLLAPVNRTLKIISLMLLQNFVSLIVVYCSIKLIRWIFVRWWGQVLFHRVHLPFVTLTRITRDVNCLSSSYIITLYM